MYTDKGIQTKIRVLLCVATIDGHDRGVKYIARKLRDAGMEVVYTTYDMIGEIVDVAIQEDVDVIGISSSTASHATLFSDVMELLKTKGAGDKLVIAGGVIPTADIPVLEEVGVRAVFGPGTSGDEVVDFILAHFDAEKNIAKK
jgi:methylmalonyl-CoA mutase C-terminal domain/subunit